MRAALRAEVSVGCARMEAVATKRWHLPCHAMAVTPQTNAGIECRNAGRSTAPAGRSWLAPRPAIRVGGGVMSLLIAMAMMPASAQSSRPAGLASSGSVRISVSVAPRYEVRAVNASTPAGARPKGYSVRLCLVTNSSVPPMPVALVRPSAPRMDDGRAGGGADEPGAMGIRAGDVRCSPIDDGFAPEVLNAADRAGGQWLLVRPE